MNDDRDRDDRHDQDDKPEPLWKIGARLFVTANLPAWAAKLFKWIREADDHDIESLARQLEPRDGDTLRAIVKTVKDEGR